MDLTQLANLGEFIGGVAVLVTCVFEDLTESRSSGAGSDAGSIPAASTISPFFSGNCISVLPVAFHP